VFGAPTPKLIYPFRPLELAVSLLPMLFAILFVVCPTQVQVRRDRIVRKANTVLIFFGFMMVLLSFYFRG
jgi:hypothetical protein